MASQGVVEKAGLEEAAVRNFIEAYNVRENSQEISFVSLVQPPLPDVKCKIGDSDLYVEVAHVYGSPSDAQQILGRGSSNKAKIIQNSLITLDKRFLSGLNYILRRKAQKTYSNVVVWLLIRNGFPLYSGIDINEHKGGIVIPQSHCFQEIWLLCGRDADAGLIKLY